MTARTRAAGAGAAAIGPLSLNTATVRDAWDLAQCVEGCAWHGIPAIAPWRDKVQAMGVAAAARRIRDAGLAVSGLCRGGMFPAADAAGRRAAVEDTRRAIGEAHAIGARCLVVLGGGLPPGSKDLPGARAMVEDGLAAVVGDARAAGVAVAVELGVVERRVPVRAQVRRRVQVEDVGRRRGLVPGGEGIDEAMRLGQSEGVGGGTAPSSTSAAVYCSSWSSCGSVSER
jgi:hypothetical protein